MSFAAVELPGRGFPTTVGFRTTSGFDVPALPAGAPAFPAAAPVASQASSFLVPQLSAKSQLLQAPLTPQPYAAASAAGAVSDPLGTPALVGSLSAVHVTHRAAEEADAATTTQDDGHVGWKGLLEISQNSGCSGVLGSRTASDEIDSRMLRDCKIEICCTAHTSPSVRRLVKSVIRGLRACQEPEKATEGMGGTYFFTNEAGRKVAIMKPCDEEPLAPNNPKGYVGRQLGDLGWKPTVRVGEAAMREVAAYLLDHDGWARVPTSVLVRARHPVFCYNSLKQQGQAGFAAARSSSLLDLEAAGVAAALAAAAAGGELPAALLPMKLGSLQEFVTHDCDTSELGPSRFSVRDVHRIGVLDVRLFNTDRHAGNMLVRTPRSTTGGGAASGADLRSRMVGADSAYELIPIDHGFCLPETLEAPYFEWLHWPQTMLPFSDDELQYIHELDVERDKAILRQELPNLRPECLRVLEVSTALLQMGAAAGLTLYDIASVMSRPFVDADEEPSELERICAYARQCVEYTVEMDTCMELREADEEELGSDADDEDADGDGSDADGGIGNDSKSSDAFAPSARAEARAVPAARLAAAERAAGSGRSRDGGEGMMLFELEDEDAYAKAKRGGALRGAGDESEHSSPFSPASSVSMGEGMSVNQLGVSLVSSSLTHGSASAAIPVPLPGSFRKAPGVLTACAAGQGAADEVARPAPMARSVHVTEGFMWRNMKTMQRTANRAVAAKSGMRESPAKRAVMRMSHAYPPPVAAFSPERMQRCFSNMTEEQWCEFMSVFRAQVQSALDQGRWRLADKEKSGGIAMSCPRF